LPVAVATAVLTLGGPITAILSFGFFKETLYWWQFLGIAIILIGLTLAVRSKKRIQLNLDHCSLIKKGD